MPGINQLGGALAVSNVQRGTTPMENSNAAAPQKSKDVQTVPPDAVKGVETAKASAKASTDEAALEGRRRSRQFSDLAAGKGKKKADEVSADDRKARSKARSERQEEQHQRAKERLERALNGRDLFSPRPIARGSE